MATNSTALVQPSQAGQLQQRRQPAARQQWRRPAASLGGLQPPRLSQPQRQLRVICRAEQSDADAATEGDAEPVASEDLVAFESLIEQAREQVAGASMDPEFMASFVGTAEAELADLKAALESSQAGQASVEAQLAAANDKLLRLSADFDNFRKRTAGEKTSLAASTKGDVVSKLLPVVDNFELAQASLKLETEGEHKVDAAYQGLYRQLVDIFRSLGVEAVPGEGSPFDPELHEAIMREPSDDVPDGTVLQEFRKGFRLGERLLRPAMVKVSHSDVVPALPKADADADGGEQPQQQEEQDAIDVTA